MDKNKVASMIDHAVLKPDAVEEDVKQACQVAREYHVASLCVKPSHVVIASRLLKGSGVKVSTVIGFPHGGTTTRCKVEEAREAIQNGAEELDMVINVGYLLSGDFDYVEKDIKAVADVCHQHQVELKAIIETCLLDDAMKRTACKLAEAAGADYVKTSTGFNGGGALLKDIEIMRQSVSPNIKIKASGGIKTWEQAVQFVQAGCSRLGTSSTSEFLSGSGAVDSSPASSE